MILLILKKKIRNTKTEKKKKKDNEAPYLSQNRKNLQMYVSRIRKLLKNCLALNLKSWKVDKH